MKKNFGLLGAINLSKLMRYDKLAFFYRNSKAYFN